MCQLQQRIWHLFETIFNIALLLKLLVKHNKYGRAIVLNKETIGIETRWESESVIHSCTSVKLIVEVVSTNWQDDYYDKLRDYEDMGIPEYWIVDYAALGGRDFIGYPKQPTIFVCELIDREYVKTMFRGNDSIKSPTFLQLNLTAQQIFDLRE